jgi:hypothetical protein
MDSYSFCESEQSHWDDPWHIRRLTSKGRFVTGEPDTLSLCGLLVDWDISDKCPVEDEHNLKTACALCREIYREEVES